VVGWIERKERSDLGSRFSFRRPDLGTRRSDLIAVGVAEAGIAKDRDGVGVPGEDEERLKRLPEGMLASQPRVGRIGVGDLPRIEQLRQ
jgi:hypothetical protein